MVKVPNARAQPVAVVRHRLTGLDHNARVESLGKFYTIHGSRLVAC